MHVLMHIRQHGGQAVVINPVIETGLVNFSSPGEWRSLLFGTEIASLYLQPDIGGDLALLTGIAKRIDEIGASDEAFLNDHCSGWTELRAQLRRLSWTELSTQSGVPQSRSTVPPRFTPPVERWSSPGPWASPIIDTASRMCRPSPIWR